jgi:hypothetical protein
VIDDTGTPQVFVEGLPPMVFVSRQRPLEGSWYWDEPRGMPGVGGHTRTRATPPGRLVIRETNGVITVLVDGANPTNASLDLVDVSAPHVTHDGESILFAGIGDGDLTTSGVYIDEQFPNGWRIYRIGIDGSGLEQITDDNADVRHDDGYDDTDPFELPDGRIGFSSTRWHTWAAYNLVRGSNIFLVDPDGTNMRRVTSERSGADRGAVEPSTGRIVFGRWWRNPRFPYNEWDDQPKGDGGWEHHEGLTVVSDEDAGGVGSSDRLSWHQAAINPDGTGLVQWSGTHHKDDSNVAYGGVFRDDGCMVANYFPQQDMTESSGFGGLRIYCPGPFEPLGIMGVVDHSLDLVESNIPWIYDSEYVTDAALLDDGRMIVSIAPDHYQDYGLYVVDADGSNRQQVLDWSETTELRTQIVRSRAAEVVLTDQVTQVPSMETATTDAPYHVDGTFTFHALNVYANAPVDAPIISAIRMGQADEIRFFLDHQADLQPAIEPSRNWPIELRVVKFNAAGEAKDDAAPANTPLFEQVRAPDGTVPALGGDKNKGVAHVAGFNYGRPGTVARCVGCHAGHTMIDVADNDEDAKFSNVAPGGTVTTSSSERSERNYTLVNRKVHTDQEGLGWYSEKGLAAGEWAQVSFGVPIDVRSVRPWAPLPSDSSDLSIEMVRVTLYADEAATVQVASQTGGPISTEGTDIAFDDVACRAVRVTVTQVTGRHAGFDAAGLSELEIIARGSEEDP